jgi:sugar phosphate isomerase/epimerase
VQARHDGGMPDLSVQLYSIRGEVAADLPRSLERLAEIGLTHVEPFDLSDPRALRAALDANGLDAPSAHARLEGEVDRVLEAAAAVGVRTVVHPMSPPEQWSSDDGVDALAEQLAAAAQKAAGYGLQVGYHNHHWERGSALARLLAGAGPEVVLELDTYWAAVGGEDVPELLGRLGDRVRLLHLKDGPINRDNAEQLPLGQGAMPVPEIIAAATAAELGVLEFDDYAGDLFDGIAAGFEYAKGL